MAPPPNPPIPIPDPVARKRAIDLGVLAASFVARDNKLGHHLIRELRDARVTRRAVYEVLLQSYLHDGYATALEATATLEHLWPTRPADKRLMEEYGWDHLAERGDVMFEMVYGSMSDRVKDYIGANSPELEAWMMVEGYGKVLGRGGLDMQTREIGTVSVLVLKHRPRQLYSHLRGSIRVGVKPAELETLIAALQNHFPETPGIDEVPFLLRTIVQKEDWS